MRTPPSTKLHCARTDCQHGWVPASVTRRSQDWTGHRLGGIKPGGPVNPQKGHYAFASLFSRKRPHSVAAILWFGGGGEQERDMARALGPLLSVRCREPPIRTSSVLPTRRAGRAVAGHRSCCGPDVGCKISAAPPTPHPSRPQCLARGSPTGALPCTTQ